MLFVAGIDASDVASEINCEVTREAFGDMPRAPDREATNHRPEEDLPKQTLGSEPAEGNLPKPTIRSEPAC